MASTDIQIVNISNLEKIESFINDSAYREVIENSENYNARLCIERRLRMPFLDPQTGVAQNHCSLFMKRRQRMPGLREGQIYTYPAARWRKSRRQYLLHQHRPFGMLRDADVDSIVGLDGSSLGAGDTDSKDSQHMMKDETVAKDWYYDEMEMHEMDAFDDPEPDSDFDYEEPYSSRRRRKRGSGPPSRRSNIANTTVIETPPPKRGRGGGRGRRKTTPSTTPSHPPQPFESGNSNDMMPHTPTSSNTMTPVRRGRPGPPPLPSNANSSPLSNSEEPQMPILTPEQKLPDDIDDKTGTIKPIEKGKATPSPYCDFCLGDARENKKTRQPEELVSCSDCGRSGHPTCLQFTTNMIISVKKYRWQCIECKYCSICGTSDNDDQLLFCDDCDRGYHMYCLSPPLTVPPEGSWSCKLCNDEFHTKK